MSLVMDTLWTEPLLTFIEELEGTRTAQRGRSYAHQGRVRQLTVEQGDPVIRAAVQGNDYRPYLTVLRLTDNYLDTECSCPVAVECKHAYAVALTLLGGAYLNGSEYQEAIKSHLPAEWRNYTWRPRPDPFKDVAMLFARVSASAQTPPPLPRTAAPASSVSTARKSVPRPAPAAVKPPQPAAPPQPWWERLLRARNNTEREHCLLEAYAERVGPTSYYYPYDFVQRVQELGHNATMLLHLEAELENAARIARRELKPAKPDYLAFVASPAVRDAVAHQERKAGMEALSAWIRRETEPPPQSARVDKPSVALELVWRLAPAPRGIDALVWQLLATTAKMDRRPRKAQAIRQLYSELTYNTREAPPRTKELVSWLATTPDVLPAAQDFRPAWGDDTLIPVGNVLNWIAAWGSRGVVHWEDGSPVDFDPRPARLAIAPGETGEYWVVEYPAPPGAPAGSVGENEPLAAAAVFAEMEVLSPYYSYPSYQAQTRPRAVYLRRGATILPLDVGGMSIEALAGARRVSEVPVELFLKQPRGVSLIRRFVRAGSGPEPANAGGLFQAVPVRPIVELKLIEGSILWLATYARTEEGRVFLRDANGEWSLTPEGDPASHWAEESPFAGLPQSQDDDQSLLPPSEEDEIPVIDGSGASPDGVESPINDGQTPSPNGAHDDAQSVVAPLNAAPQNAVPAAPPGRILVPNEADLAPLEQWLATFISPGATARNHGQNRFAHEWTTSGETETRAIRAWPERPRGPLYLGNTAFLRLVSPVARPQLKIEIEPAGVDWLQVSVEMEGELAQLSARDIEALLAASESALVRLPDGRLYRREGLESLGRELTALEDVGLAPGQRGQRLHAFHLAGEAGQRLMDLGHADDQLATLGANARRVLEDFAGIPTAPVDSETAVHLRPYQRLGADFLAWSGHTFGGALLADEMGLGKTLQVLATLTALRDGRSVNKPSLVICPASVAHNWRREAERFAPSLKVLVLERGSERKAYWDHLGEYDLVIKNYALTRRDATVLRQYEWLMVCVDEAQAIKNPKAEIAAVVKSIPAEHRIALTGTPIENRLGDLISIMEFTTPGLLTADLAGRGKRGEKGATDQAALARRLRARLRPVLLRRLKTEVAPELPDRIEERIDCALTDNQRKAYLAEVKRTRELLRSLPGQKIVGAGRIQILAALTRLRQLCLDPALVQLPGLGSGKTDELMDLLPPILEAGHKVLLFSQFVRMLNRLEDRLKREKIPTWLLTGQTQHRQELVERFESDPTPGVFLISLKAGGTGLNLVSASHVVLFDPWWNPAVEAQAIDRTHRIGQYKTVVACRLVAEGTIEERIMELQERKRTLVRDVLDDASFNRTLSREDFEFLLE